MRRAAALAALGAAAVALSLAVSLASIARHYEGAVTWEAAQYAEIGRNLLETGLWRTRAVTPWTLAALDARGEAFDTAHPAPVLDRFALQSLLCAAAERLAGADDAANAALSALLMAGAVAATYAVGVLFFSVEEALAAALLLALDPSFQRGFVLWGYPDFGFLILVVLAGSALCAGRAGESSSARGARLALAGALAGGAWLARSNFELWLPLWAWALWRGARGTRARDAALFSAAFVAVCAPAAVYDLRHFGGLNPPTLAWDLADKVMTPSQPWLYYRVYSPWEVLVGHAPALARKFLALSALYLRGLPWLWQMTPAFGSALIGAWSLVRGRQEPARRWSLLMAAMLAAQIAAFSFLRFETLGAHVGGRYLLWFAPAELLLAARGARALARRWGLERGGPVLLALLCAAWFSGFWRQPQGGSTYPGGLGAARWPQWDALAAVGDGLIVSNMPAQVAWYARRAAVALPAEPEDLARIAARHEVSAILIFRIGAGELAQTPKWIAAAADPSGAGRAQWSRLGYRSERDWGSAVLLTPASGAR